MKILIFSGCVNKIQDIESLYSESMIDDHGIDVEINYYLKGPFELIRTDEGKK